MKLQTKHKELDLGWLRTHIEILRSKIASKKLDLIEVPFELALLVMVTSDLLDAVEAVIAIEREPSGSMIAFNMCRIETRKALGLIEEDSNDKPATVKCTCPQSMNPSYGCLPPCPRAKHTTTPYTEKI